MFSWLHLWVGTVYSPTAENVPLGPLWTSAVLVCFLRPDVSFTFHVIRTALDRNPVMTQASVNAPGRLLWTWTGRRRCTFGVPRWWKTTCGTEKKCNMLGILAYGRFIKNKHFWFRNCNTSLTFHYKSKSSAKYQIHLSLVTEYTAVKENSAVNYTIKAFIIYSVLWLWNLTSAEVERESSHSISFCYAHSCLFTAVSCVLFLQMSLVKCHLMEGRLL